MKHNFFIDESCHLEHDGFSAMCIGCIKVPENMQEKYKADIKNIKLKLMIIAFGRRILNSSQRSLLCSMILTPIPIESSCLAR